MRYKIIHIIFFQIQEIVLLETKDVGSGDIGNEKDSLLPKTNSCNVCSKKSELERDIILKELQRSNVSQEDIKKLTIDQNLDKITTNILQDLTHSSKECRCSTLSHIESLSDNNDSSNSGESKIVSTPEKSIISFGGINVEVPNRNVETTFQIHSSKKDDKSEINDIAEKKDKVGDLLRIGDNSLVSVKVRYIQTHKSQRNPIILDNTQKCSKVELIEDRSEEIIHSRVTPMQQVIQFQAAQNIQTSAKPEEVKPLKVTYKNPHDYRSTTDSATESQSSEIENYGIPYVKEMKMKLKAVTDQKEQERKFPLNKYGKVKSLGNLR